ncbi:MAG: S1C family serine protease [Blastocatellales bacterium]
MVEAQNQDGVIIARGSGFFLERSNKVVTNLHVLKRASRANVKVLGENITYKVVSIYGIDWEHDLCVLELNGASVIGLNLSQFDVEVGDDIVAAGNPKGLEGTFSKGIVSAVRRSEDLIQIDAAISPGSSGGPVVNNRGEVIGVAVLSIIGGQNLNFAIPVKFIKEITPIKADVIAAGVLSLTDLEIEHLKGTVRSVIVRRAKFKYDQYNDNIIEQPAALRERHLYDENQRRRRFTLYSDKGESFDQQYEYDSKGILSSQITIIDGKPRRSQFTPEEAVNNKISRRTFSITRTFPAPEGVHTLTYDEYGNEIERVIKNDKETTRIVNTFDTDGTQIDSKAYVDGSLQYALRYSYKFDHVGNWIERFETNYDTKYPTLGYTPSEKVYREIRYY